MSSIDEGHNAGIGGGSEGNAEGGGGAGRDPDPSTEKRGATQRTPSGGDRTAVTGSQLTDSDELGGTGDISGG